MAILGDQKAIDVWNNRIRLAKHTYLLEDVRSVDVIPLMKLELVEYMLENEMQEIVACAARWLYMKQNPRGKKIIHDKLHDADAATRRIFLQVLSEIKDTWIMEEFLTALKKESHPDLCLEFASQLSRIPDTEMVRSALIRELEQKDPHRRWMAIRIAGRLKTGWATRRLHLVLRTEPDQALKRLIRKSVAKLF